MATRIGINFPMFVLASILMAVGVEAAPATTQKTPYDEELAKRLLNLSAGAYAFSATECIEKSIPAAHQWTLLSSLNETCDAFSNLCSFYAVVAEAQRQIYVVFRGTKSKKQLFVEGWQSLQPGADFFGIGKVNKYFFRAHATLWDNLLPILTEPKHKDYAVVFTGHSLGGALASIASIRTVLDGLRKSHQIKLYTFGQPRVGDIRFSRKHDELVPHSFRVVHRLDIVPHLAPCAKDKADPRVDETSDSVPCDPEAVGIAYHHGTEIWYPNGMGQSAPYYECLGTPKDEDFDCSDSMSFELSKYETYISDHRHYFDHKVPSYGKLGCKGTPSQEEALPIDAVAATSPAGMASGRPKPHDKFSRVAHLVSSIIGRRRRR